MASAPLVLVLLDEERSRRALRVLAPWADSLRLRWTTNPDGDLLGCADLVIADGARSPVESGEHLNARDPDWENRLGTAARRLAMRAARTAVAEGDPELTTGTSEAHGCRPLAAAPPLGSLGIRLLLVWDFGSATSVALLVAQALADAGVTTLVVDARPWPAIPFLHGLGPRDQGLAAPSPARGYAVAPAASALTDLLEGVEPIADTSRVEHDLAGIEACVVVTPPVAPPSPVDGERTFALRTRAMECAGLVLAGGIELETRVRIAEAALWVGSRRSTLAITLGAPRARWAQSAAAALERTLAPRMPKGIELDVIGVETVPDEAHQRLVPLPRRCIAPLRSLVGTLERAPRLPIAPVAPPLAPVDLEWLVPTTLADLYREADGRSR